MVWLAIDLIAGRGGYQKRESPEVGISAKCHHLHDCMAQVILFTLHFSYRGILVTITRGNNWRVVRRICVLSTTVGDRNLQRAVRRLLHPFPLCLLHLLPLHHSANGTPHLLVHTDHWQCFYAKNKNRLKKKKTKNANNYSALVYIYQLMTDAQKLKQIVVTKVKIQQDFQSSLLQTVIYFLLTFSNKGLNLSANSHSRAWTLS